MRTKIIAAAIGCSVLTATVWWLDQPEPRLNMKPLSGDYWAHRVAYPTMHFSPSWFVDAKAEDARVQSGVPAGEQSAYLARRAASPIPLDTGAWTFLGPQPKVFNNWNQVSGRVNVIAVDPSGPDAGGMHTVFSAADGGGVWKSTNCCGAGTTWTNVTDQPDINSIAIGDLHIDPNDSNIVYAGTGDLRYGSFSFGTAGLLKSTDKGETWQVLGEDVFTPFYPPSAGLGFPQYQAIGKVVTDPNNSSTVVVGTKTGLYFSYNGGTAWTGPCVSNPHSSQRQDITGLEAVPRTGGGTWLYAAVGTRGNPTPVQPDLANLGANGVYRAVMPASGCPAPGDWTLLANGWPAGTGDGNPSGKVLGRIELAVAPSNPQVIYAMGSHATASNVLGVWRSNDGGDSWAQTAVTADVQAGGCSFAAGGGSQMWYDANLTVDPNSTENVMLSGVDLYRSTNGGDTFQNITCGYGNGNVHVDHHATAYLPTASGYDSNALLVGTDGGVYVTGNALFGTGGSNSDNRPTYISLNETIGSIEFYSGDISGNFATSPQPGASGGAQDNGSSFARWTGPVGQPAVWTVRNAGDGIYTRIEPVNEQRWYWSSQNGNIFVSPNGPNSGTQPATPQTSPAWGGDVLSFVMPFEIYRYGALDAAGSGCTTATGCTYLIAGTNRVWETLQGGIPRTSWYPNSPVLTKNTLGNRSFINQLAHAVKTPTAAIAGTNDGNVWYGHGLNVGTADSASWVNVTAANAVLPNRPVMDVTLDVPDAANPGAAAIGYAALGGFDQNTPNQPGHIYQLVCENHCATATWRNISGNLPNIPANSVAFNPKIPKQVFAGTDWGLYYTDDAFAAEVIWQRFDKGLPKVMVWDMAIDRGFSTLAVFTRGRGAWAWPLPAAPSTELFKDGFEQPVF
ncbi:WD40/YVTN/BNR-like repeat-containing protein [Aquimonas sp.]|uniref:WD40/YVTN/BNR-like repeat-containing protein n=1 Tax=Aquimonas sp. TaxID=1872588 RepID=UPI0037C15803